MRVLSYGISVPYVGVPHAGGEYYLRHVLALLRAGHSVTVLVPATEENRRAVDAAPDGVQVVLIEPTGRVAEFRDWINRRFRPARTDVALLNGVLRNPAARSAALHADLFELQWTQMAGQIRALRWVRRDPVPAVLVAHDVLAQAMLRVRRQHTTLLRRRFLRFVRWWTTVRDERRLLDAVDLVLTFSEKDRQLLHSGTSTRVEVLEPPLEPLARVHGRDPRHGEVLFVGAFDRHENAQAAAWFLREVWPAVHAQEPAARFRLVGASPPGWLRELAKAAPAVEVTGYVDDLDDSYRSASVVVVPLLTGAGVKFKTVTAMIWGVPVVSTSIGIEGIEAAAEGGFRGLADEPTEFAAKVLEAVRDPAARDEDTRAVRLAAMARYGNDRFNERVRVLYSTIAGSSPASATLSGRAPGAHR